VLYVEIERFWKNGRKKRGPFFLMWGLFRAKNTRNGTARNMGYGLRPDRDSYAMLSSFGRCYMGKNESPFKFTFVYRPGKVGCLCCLSLFCPPTSKGHIFSTVRPILGEFYVKSKGFPCSTWKSSDFGRMDEKRGGLSSSCGAFSGLKIPGMALLGTWGTGLRPDRDSYAMLSSFGRCYMGKNESPFQFQPRLSPRAKSAVCAIFRCFALQLQKAISFQPLGRFG